jgi:hypothetical protein
MWPYWDERLQHRFQAYPRSSAGGKVEVREYGQLKPPLRPFLIQRVLKSNTPLDLAV